MSDHICGDPASACDQSCADRYYEREAAMTDHRAMNNWKAFFLDGITISPEQLDAVCDSHEALRAQRDAALDALRAVEWGWHHARCPCCNRPKAELGHYPDCVLAAALRA